MARQGRRHLPDLRTDRQFHPTKLHETMTTHHSTMNSDTHTAKLRERIAELEQQLATSLTPRPIAEAGPVKEGFVRLFVNVAHPQHVRSMHWVGDTHFIDIKLPSPDPRAEYERAVTEAGGHYEAWLQAKGGAQ